MPFSLQKKLKQEKKGQFEDNPLRLPPRHQASALAAIYVDVRG